VSFYISNGLNPGADGGPVAPTNHGGDLWTIDPGSLMGGPAPGTDCGSTTNGMAGMPRFTDYSAYVNDYTVVAHFTSLPISFGTSSFFKGATIQLSDAVIVGRLQPAKLNVGSSFSLTDGVIAGRWPTAALLATLSYIPDGLVSGSYLCGTDKTYQAMKNVVCATADIASDKNTTNMSAPCDAISFALAFTAIPALPGVVAAAPPVPRGCSENGAVPMDCCGCTATPSQ
jgi:hypothetical protein